MPLQPDKRSTQINMGLLRGNEQVSEITGPTFPSNRPKDPQREHQNNRLNKRRGSPLQEPTRKLRSQEKDLTLTGMVDSGKRVHQSLFVRDESPWDTFKKNYECELAGTVAVVVHRARPSSLFAIKTFLREDTDKMLQIFRRIQHENVISAVECFRNKDSLHVVLEHLPVSLDQIVACPAYPDETQLSSVLAQVISLRCTNNNAADGPQILDGLSYLAAEGFEHRSLNCSNVLLSIRGDVKIGM